MSILIKGLKMPSDTFVPIRIYNGVAKVFRGNGNIDCFEVIELPDHGDLVDRDALMEHECYVPFQIGNLAVIYRSYVKNAPVVIPAERSEDE